MLDNDEDFPSFTHNNKETCLLAQEHGVKVGEKNSKSVTALPPHRSAAPDSSP